MKFRKFWPNIAFTGLIIFVQACGERVSLEVVSIERASVSLDTIYAGSEFPSNRLGDTRTEPVEVYTITISSDLDLFAVAGPDPHPWIYLRMERCSTIEGEDHSRWYQAFLDQQDNSETNRLLYNVYLDVDWYLGQLSEMGTMENLCAWIVNPRMFNDGIRSNTIEFSEADFEIPLH